jgi:ferredoxin
MVRVRIDAGLCQGHGRCYDLAPALFGDDEEGYGRVLGDGAVPADKEDDARRAVLNCPEHAIAVIEAPAINGPVIEEPGIGGPVSKGAVIEGGLHGRR